MLSLSQLRWFAIGVLILSSALNYLDRMVLSALMPTLREEFQITGADLGNLVGIFYLVYGVSSPLAGMLVDRIGLTWGACVVVILWSLAGMATGLAGSFAGLLACRAALGFAEAGGIPVTGKAFAVYLPPEGRALGAAISQIGLTLGTMTAPILTEWLSPKYGWRSVFVAAGALGFLWVPVWLWTARYVPPLKLAVEPPRPSFGEILRDTRFIALIVANILAMGVYGLWLNWVTYFLVAAYQMPREEANLRFAWIPPVFATLGGLFGGWLALRSIRAGAAVLKARMRIAFIASLFVLVTAAVPLMPDPAFAVAGICISLFAITCLSVNYYAIPLDLYGAQRAAFGVSFLTGAFGLMMGFLSPQIGRWSDTVGWRPVCFLVAGLPLLSVGVLQLALRRRT